MRILFYEYLVYIEIYTYGPFKYTPHHQHPNDRIWSGSY